MTRTQRNLARHALGLPNLRRQSYRNRFVAAYVPGDYDHWLKMVEAGEAECAPLPHNGRKTRHFWLTDKGAMSAIDPGEKLCPEDFPHIQ